MDPLEQVLRPIIEGQIRSFIHDHPEVAQGWKVSLLLPLLLLTTT
jgi:hypothetical protein